MNIDEFELSGEKLEIEKTKPENYFKNQPNLLVLAQTSINQKQIEENPQFSICNAWSLRQHKNYSENGAQVTRTILGEFEQAKLSDYILKIIPPGTKRAKTIDESFLSLGFEIGNALAHELYCLAYDCDDVAQKAKYFQAISAIREDILPSFEKILGRDLLNIYNGDLKEKIQLKTLKQKNLRDPGAIPLEKFKKMVKSFHEKLPSELMTPCLQVIASVWPKSPIKTKVGDEMKDYPFQTFNLDISARQQLVDFIFYSLERFYTRLGRSSMANCFAIKIQNNTQYFLSSSIPCSLLTKRQKKIHQTQVIESQDFPQVNKSHGSLELIDGGKSSQSNSWSSFSQDIELSSFVSHKKYPPKFINLALNEESNNRNKLDVLASEDFSKSSLAVTPNFGEKTKNLRNFSLQRFQSMTEKVSFEFYKFSAIVPFKSVPFEQKDYKHQICFYTVCNIEQWFLTEKHRLAFSEKNQDQINEDSSGIRLAYLALMTPGPGETRTGMGLNWNSRNKAFVKDDNEWTIIEQIYYATLLYNANQPGGNPNHLLFLDFAVNKSREKIRVKGSVSLPQLKNNVNQTAYELFNSLGLYEYFLEFDDLVIKNILNNELENKSDGYDQFRQFYQNLNKEYEKLPEGIKKAKNILLKSAQQYFEELNHYYGDKLSDTKNDLSQLRKAMEENNRKLVDLIQTYLSIRERHFKKAEFELGLKSIGSNFLGERKKSIKMLWAFFNFQWRYFNDRYYKACDLDQEIKLDDNFQIQVEFALSYFYAGKMAGFSCKDTLDRCGWFEVELQTRLIAEDLQERNPNINIIEFYGSDIIVTDFYWQIMHTVYANSICREISAVNFKHGMNVFSDFVAGKVMQMATYDLPVAASMKNVINSLDQYEIKPKNFCWQVPQLENPKIFEILCEIKIPEKRWMLVPTRQEVQALNQLKEIALENLLKCFPNRSEEIKKLLTEKFNSSLQEIQEEQTTLTRVKFYEHCFQHIYYFIRLRAKDNKFKIQATDRFPAFENPSYSENVLDIIESAVKAILGMATKSGNENPGELLKKYHLVLFQNFVSEKNPNESASRIDFIRLSILEQEVQDLPEFLSIENLNYILEEIEFLRYIWREELYQQKFGEEDSDEKIYSSPIKFQNSPVKSQSEKKDIKSNTGSGFFSLNFSSDN